MADDKYKDFDIGLDKTLTEAVEGKPVSPSHEPITIDGFIPTSAETEQTFKSRDISDLSDFDDLPEPLYQNVDGSIKTESNISPADHIKNVRDKRKAQSDERIDTSTFNEPTLYEKFQEFSTRKKIATIGGAALAGAALIYGLSVGGSYINDYLTKKYTQSKPVAAAVVQAPKQTLEDKCSIICHNSTSQAKPAAAAYTGSTSHQAKTLAQKQMSSANAGNKTVQHAQAPQYSTGAKEDAKPASKPLQLKLPQPKTLESEVNNISWNTIPALGKLTPTNDGNYSVKILNGLKDVDNLSYGLTTHTGVLAEGIYKDGKFTLPGNIVNDILNGKITERVTVDAYVKEGNKTTHRASYVVNDSTVAKKGYKIKTKPGKKFAAGVPNGEAKKPKTLISPVASDYKTVPTAPLNSYVPQNPFSKKLSSPFDISDLLSPNRDPEFCADKSMVDDKACYAKEQKAKVTFDEPCIKSLVEEYTPLPGRVLSAIGNNIYLGDAKQMSMDELGKKETVVTGHLKITPPEGWGTRIQVMPNNYEASSNTPLDIWGKYTSPVKVEQKSEFENIPFIGGIAHTVKSTVMSPINFFYDTRTYHTDLSGVKVPATNIIDVNDPFLFFGMNGAKTSATIGLYNLLNPSIVRICTPNGFNVERGFWDRGFNFMENGAIAYSSIMGINNLFKGPNNYAPLQPGPRVGAPNIR